MYSDLAKVTFQHIMLVFEKVSSWKEEYFRDETGRFWKLFKIQKSVFQSPAPVLWPDFSCIYCIGWRAWLDYVVRNNLGKTVTSSVFVLLGPTSFSCGCFSVLWSSISPNSSSVTQRLNLLLHYLFSEEIPFLPINYFNWDLNLVAAEWLSSCSLGFQQVGGRDFGDEGQEKQERLCSHYSWKQSSSEVATQLWQ